MNLSSFGIDAGKKQTAAEKPLTQTEKTNLNINYSTIHELTNRNCAQFLPWFLKYQITNYEQLPKTKEIKKIISFLEKPINGKGLLVVGPAGCGKTTTITLLANHFDYELVEMNASDVRNKASIEEFVGGVINQKSLFGKKKLLLIDEVDGVSGTEDRGGVAQLSKMIKESKIPLLFTANDEQSEKIATLKKACQTVSFLEHTQELLFTVANNIFTIEKVLFNKEELELFIKKRNTFDIRGFINDLQLCTEDLKFIPFDEVELRNYKLKIDNILHSIFSGTPKQAYDNCNQSDIDYEDLALYVEENAFLQLSGSGLAQGFEQLAKADIFKRRIMKWQYWRYLVYIYFYLTYGVSGVKTKVTSKEFKRNERILKKWILSNSFSGLKGRTKEQKKKNEPLTPIENIAQSTHTSIHKSRRENLPYLAFIAQKNPASILGKTSVECVESLQKF